MALSDAPDDRLPASMFPSLQTYKRSTAVLLEWLHSHDKNDQHESNVERFTVRQILERAEMIARGPTKPPTRIQHAFKAVLVNRRMLTQYYQTLRLPSAATEDSTERHKYFNDTLAQAYQVLFPKIHPTPKKKKKKSPTPSSPILQTSVNTFEVLSGIMEKEPDSDSSSTRSDDEDTTTDRSTIADDPIEARLALHLYVLEMQTLVSTVKNIWVSVNNGSLSMTVAGWVTNWALQAIRETAWVHGKTCGLHAGLLDNYVQGQFNLPTFGSTAQELLASGVDKLRESSSFHELTTGGGLIWPYEELLKFRRNARAKDILENKADRKRFNDYFRSAAEEMKLKENFAVELVELVKPSCHGNNPEDFDGAAKAIYDKRYAWEKDMVQSILRSVFRLPLYQKMVKPGDPFKEEHPLLRKYVQSVYSTPLCWDLQQFLSNPEDKTESSFIVALHLFLESGRGYMHGDASSSSVTRSPPNCRILALKLAKDFKRSMEAFLDKCKDPAMKGMITWSSFVPFKLSLDLLEDFTSDNTFDLYSQSPWVAGSYMSSILGRATSMGLELYNEGGVLCRLLHLYEMIQQVGPEFPRIPILDGLLDLFSEAVLLDNTSGPNRRFSSPLEAALGGAVICDKSGDPRTRILVSDLSRTHAFCGNGRIDTRLSVFALEGFTYSHVCHPGFQKRLLSDKLATRNESNFTAGKHMHRLFQKHSLPELVERARKVVEPEFEGPFPLARVNHIAVFMLLLDIWKEMTTRLNAPGGHPQELLSTALADPIEFLDGLADHGERIGAAMFTAQLIHLQADLLILNKLEHKLKKHSGLIMMRDSMLKVCEGVKLEDYFWKEI